jgi:hypothetical protein
MYIYMCGKDKEFSDYSMFQHKGEGMRGMG